MDMTTVDIILPVYNEEEVLPGFHRSLMSVLDTLSHRYRFSLIYVLDPSADRSFSVLKDLAQHCPAMTILCLSRRFGHQMSLVAGIDRSVGEAVIMMDSDLQHPPEIIPLLLANFEQGYDIVHTIRKYDHSVGVFKRWTSRLFYRLQNTLSPVDIQEGMADFRLISRKVVRLFQTSVREQNQFLRGLFRWVGFRSTTVSFSSPPRAAGKTKYHLARLLAFSVVGITSFSKVPLRLATLVGFAMSALTLVYGFWLLTEFFRAGHFPPGYTSLILVVLFIGGLQLIVLGIVGEYLGAVFDEAKHRPLYIIDEIVEGGQS
jgi:polyisoprenyl-phosphate glycosyltransferase